MLAATRERYGPPAQVIEVKEVDAPVPTDDQVLVRVKAVSLNRYDWYTGVGRPLMARPMMGWRRPKSSIVGADYAGIVEDVGRDVVGFAVGDEVFGTRDGAAAQFVAVKNAIARKPANLSFEEAACLGIGGVTALQGLRDHGELKAGQRVLINGASGSVGLLAVQIAKALGAHVDAVCSTRNIELVGSLGPERVFDYTREDFTRGGEYDVILDVAGSRSWPEYERVLQPGGTLVVVGAPMKGGLLGPLGHIISLKLRSLRSKEKVVFFVSKGNRDDLNALRELCESGQLRPVVERTYDLSQTAEALTYMGTGHVQSKLVITV